MSALDWLSGVNGNWSDGTKWSGGAAPTSADDLTVDAAGAYGIAVSTADVANSLTFNAAGAFISEAATGSLSIVHAFNLEAGTVILRAANSFGSVNVTGGHLQLYNAAALGSAVLSLVGGELSGMTSLAIGNRLDLGGSVFTIDAAAGAKVEFGAGGWFLDETAAPVVTFGSASRGGTVIWRTGPGSALANPGSYTVSVAGGTLKGGDSNFYFLFSADTSTTVAAGATLDLNGFSITAPDLQGAGAIVNSGAAASLTLNGGNFGGVISGAIAVEIAGSAIFTKAQTYTLGTTIDSGQSLITLGAGSVAGPIVDNGLFGNSDSTGVFTAGLISGTGFVEQTGPATLVLNHGNTFSGGADILAGKVLIGNDSGLGTGAVFFGNAEVIGTANETLGNVITLFGNVTLAASTGTTLNMTGGASMTWDASGGPLKITFGDAGHTGTVALSTISETVDATNPIHIKLAYGTLKTVGGAFGLLAASATDMTISAGATLDLWAAPLGIANLTSAGAIINSSGTTTTLSTEGVSSATGTISDRIAVHVFNGKLTLAAADTYTGGTTIYAGATLQLGTGGAAGSIVGAINDQGSMVVNESGAVALSGVISGGGTLTQSGTGVTTIAVGNSYTGGTTIQHGEIVADRGNALGVGGVITMTGGELLGGATEALSHDLNTKGTVTIAAATGTTLTLNTANDTYHAGLLKFGEGANNGVIVFKASSDSFSDTAHTRVEVAAGTLKAGDGFGLTNLLVNIAGTRIDAGATVDAGGHELDIDALTGPGTVTNSGAAAFLTLFGATAFAGVVAGKWVEVDLFNTAVLNGNETFTGTAVIEGGTVTLGGLFAEATRFNGGTLILTAPSRFTGTVEGFDTGGTIDLRNITAGGAAVVGYNAATGVLTVSDGTRTDQLTLVGSYQSGNFGVASDGSGGTDVIFQAVAAKAPPPTAVAVSTAPPHPFVSAMAGFGAPAGAALVSAGPTHALVHPSLSAPSSAAA